MVMDSSTIKSVLYTFALGSLIFYTTTRIVTGIEISEDFTYWFMAFGVFFVAQFLVPKLLKFFTLPKNIFSYWLLSAIVNFAAFYAMSLFLPGIIIRETPLAATEFGFISISASVLSPDFTMVFASIYAGLLSSLFYWLKSD